MQLSFSKLSVAVPVGAIRSPIWNLAFFVPRTNLLEAQVLLASLVPCYFVAIFRAASARTPRIITA